MQNASVTFRIARVVNDSTSQSALDDLVVALADLYLDTEVRDGLPKLAERMASSGMSATELELLWRKQVTPSVHWNLKSTAGEWAGFDRTWLLREVARRADRPGLVSVPIVGALVHRFRAFGAEREFRVALALATRLTRMPPVPTEQRARRVAMWEALAHVYFGVDSAPRQPGAERRSTERLARNYADRLVRKHGLGAGELLEEFHAICDLFAEVLSGEQLKYLADSQVGAWLDSLGDPKS